MFTIGSAGHAGALADAKLTSWAGHSIKPDQLPSPSTLGVLVGESVGRSIGGARRGESNVMVGAIDIVVNPLTPRIVAARPTWTREFHIRKIGRAVEDVQSVTLEQMLSQMDAAGIERAFLVAAKMGQEGTPGAWHMPYEWIVEAVQQYPSRFSGLAGIDPTEGMAGLRRLERAVKEQGFIGAHTYPHWYELPPTTAATIRFMPSVAN